MAAMTMLAVTNNATTPTPPPTAIVPSFLPSTARATGAPTKTPTNRKMARFIQSKPPPPRPRRPVARRRRQRLAVDRPMIRSTAASDRRAKSFCESAA